MESTIQNDGLDETQSVFGTRQFVSKKLEASLLLHVIFNTNNQQIF